MRHVSAAVQDTNLLQCSGNIAGSAWSLTNGAGTNGGVLSFTNAVGSNVTQNVSAKLLPNTTYTISGIFAQASTSFTFGVNDGSSGNFTTTLSQSSSTQTFSFTTSATIGPGANIFIGSNGTAGTVTPTNLKLQVGATATRYQGNTICPSALSNAFWISPTIGNDVNPGTQSQPFLTLEKAQASMQAQPPGGKKTTVCMAGTYNRTVTLNLGSADNGTTYQYDPNSGFNTAIFDGTNGGNFLDGIFVILGGSNITINGLQMQNCQRWCVGIHGGVAVASYEDWPAFKATYGTASHNTVTNCIVHDTHYTAYFVAPLIAIGDVPNTTFSHNVVYNAPIMGIMLDNNAIATQVGPGQTDISNGLIDSNVCYHTGYGGTADAGVIYTQQYGQHGTGVFSTNIRITNNRILDWATYKCIYCDEGASNTSITGNVIGPQTNPGNADGGTSASYWFIGSGNSVTYTGNIIDLGPSGFPFCVIEIQDSNANEAMAGDAFNGNIILSSYSGSQGTFFGGTQVGSSFGYGGTIPNALQIANNVWHNYSTGTVNTGGFGGGGDTNPVLVNPQISGWNYTIANGSPVFNSPVNFPPIIGNWGPPGFVVPQVGQAPSSPH